MNELDFQREIVESARELGGFAMKMSNRFMVGVPDLLVKLPMLSAALVECKFHRWPVREETEIDLTPTPHQLKRLMDFQSAGGLSGIFHFTIIGSNKICLAVNPIVRSAVQDDFHGRSAHCKDRGQPWPLPKMIQSILLCNNAARPTATPSSTSA